MGSGQDEMEETTKPASPHTEKAGKGKNFDDK